MIKIYFSLAISINLYGTDSNTSLYIHQFPLELKSRSIPEKITKIDVIFHTSSSNELYNFFSKRYENIKKSNSNIEFQVLKYPNEKSLKPNANFSNNSFVVDFESPIFKGLEAEFIKFYKEPSPKKVGQYVDYFIKNKDMSRSFDLASAVAKNKKGDCTEHAVLSAAMMRLNKIPSRIVTGILIVHENNKFQAYGHAWNEYWYKNSWYPADATRPDLAPNLFYIPLSIMEDETMNYQVGNIDALLKTQIQKIELNVM